MSTATYIILSKAIAIIGFCYLVTVDRPWWGLLCFFALAWAENKENLK
jgi:hypothetical protein